CATQPRVREKTRCRTKNKCIPEKSPFGTKQYNIEPFDTSKYHVFDISYQQVFPSITWNPTNKLERTKRKHRNSQYPDRIEWTFR
ncbi:MAG: hypothetical protein ABJL67_11525, partial [Sulfitobacter sp.]